MTPISQTITRMGSHGSTRIEFSKREPDGAAVLTVRYSRIRFGAADARTALASDASMAVANDDGGVAADLHS